MLVWEFFKTQVVNEVLINFRLLYLMVCLFILFSRNECVIDDRFNYEVRFNEMFRYYQLMVLFEKKDSFEVDGFFNVVSFGFNFILRSDLFEIELVKQYFVFIGYYIDEENSLDDNVFVLREFISDEWLVREEEYSKFLVLYMISFKEEVQAFKKKGYFKGIGVWFNVFFDFDNFKYVIKDSIYGIEVFLFLRFLCNLG